ncbi:MAG: Stk1 family PASTA domain-containing Ser/Thr kinase [Solirubrobacterales bacterium]|nr:Stk1 family PASTA domain-containing Ser/Thr kinase [Solirubrobacterales bacterium]
MASARKNLMIDERYRLERKIGSGGMADVWLAEDTELDRKVAIKILHESFAEDQEFVERFRREAQAAAGLQHPNVVGIFDRGEFRDTYFIAMEYVDGPQLKELVKGGMGVQDAIDFTRQILNAARFAHRKGIIHRDLKPQNVLIDDEGRARVADFGIARSDRSDITATGSVMGTAQYLSPEQAQGKDTTARSDIYSIGVILYEALTGQVPFDGDSAVAVALKQVNDVPRHPSSINSDVPPALDAVVMRALAKDPERRFNDADAFLKALDAAEKAPDTPRRQDTAVFAAVGPEGEASDAGYLDEEEREEGEEEEARRRRRRWIALALAVMAVAVMAVAGLVAFLVTRSNPDQVEVPDVLGQQVGVATEVLQNRGFDVDTTYSASAAPENQVIEQDPIPSNRGGSDIDEGSTIVLAVSSGPGITEVPDVQGLNEADATKRLEEQGFKVKPSFQFSSDVPNGRAVGTQPASGARIQSGSTVKLLISRGSNQAEVPSVVGLQTEQAIDALDAAGLGSNVVQRDDDAPAGEVVDQAPSAGRSVKKNSTVTIFVSTGAISVPGVVGQPRKQAVSALKQAGFSVAIEEDTSAPASKTGIVVDQFPPGGSRGQRGDTVTIVVGDAPPVP